MTDDDRSAYRDAFSAAQRRLERNGSKIDHVIWEGGHLTASASKPVPAEVDEYRPTGRQGILI